MKWKVLISAPYFQPVIEQYRSFFIDHDIEIIVPEVHERLSEEELLQYVTDIDGALCGDDHFTRKVLEQAKKLKVLSKWGTGIASIDQGAAKEFGIAVRNTPNAFTDAVADLAMGFILSFARNIPWADRDIRAGEWSKKRDGVALSESIIGIVGLGNIGRALARRAHAFGATLLGFEAQEVPQDFLAATAIQLVSLEQLLKTSDFITLHCTLNETTHHLIGNKQFLLMKPTAVIVNTARGALIDESSLIEALRNKQIVGAGLDVFEEEPLPLNSPLRTFQNVLFSPHNANASPSARERVHKNTIKNLIEELQKHDVS